MTLLKVLGPLAVFILPIALLAADRNYLCQPDGYPLPMSAQRSLVGEIQKDFGFRPVYDSVGMQEKTYPSLYPWGLLVTIHDNERIEMSAISVSKDILNKKAPVSGPEFSFSLGESDASCGLKTASGKTVPLNVTKAVQSCYTNVAQLGATPVSVVLHPLFVSAAPDSVYDRVPFAAAVSLHWMLDLQGDLFEHHMESLSCISLAWPDLPGASDKRQY